MSSRESVAENETNELERRMDELEQQVSELEAQIEPPLEEQIKKPEIKKLIMAIIRQVRYESAKEVQGPIDEMDDALLPIQNISRFPEAVAQEKLGATDYRARAIWKDYKRLSKRAQGGRTIKAGELKRILQAQASEDEQIYTATVGRVMEAMVDLTRGIAEVSKGPDGERRLFIPNDWKQLAETERDR